MHRSLPLLRRCAAIPAIAALLFPLARLPAADAQQEREVELRLVSQTPVVTPQRPIRLSVRVRNGGDRPIRDLNVALWMYHPALSRSAYAQGLEGEHPTEPLSIAPFPRRGAIPPGGTRRFRIQHRLPETIRRGGNALYPVKVQLESAGVAVGELHTMVVFIRERPLVPLNVSLTFVLDEPMLLLPDGAFAEGAERVLAPRARLGTVLSAIQRSPIRSTLAVAPALVEQLREMADGYRSGEEAEPVEADDRPARRAARMLDRMRAVARSPFTEVVALPYAAPSVPSLVAADLEDDLERQVRFGRRVLEEVLGVSPASPLFRPPGSLISHDSMDPLAELGVETLILDDEVVTPPPQGDLTPPSTASVGSGMTAVVPDPTLQSYLTAPMEDPRLRAIQMVGELSAIYFETPSVVRGVALVLDAGSRIRPAFLQTLLRALDASPQVAWLQPKQVSGLMASDPPDGREHRRRLREAEYDPISPALVAELHRAREALRAFRAMAPQAPLPDRLESLLLLAQARDLSPDALAFDYPREVRDRLALEFAKVEAPSGSSVTLTSHGGVIPVTLRSLAEYDVRVRVTLRSSRLHFVEGPTQEVTLTGEARALTFPVRAQATGRFPVAIVVQSPEGRVVSETRIVVRSTAYNRVALLVTIGAALFLAAWWGRRFVRRERS